MKVYVSRWPTFADGQLIGPAAGVRTDESLASFKQVPGLTVETARAAVRVGTRGARAISVQRGTRVSTRYHYAHTHINQFLFVFKEAMPLPLAHW